MLDQDEVARLIQVCRQKDQRIFEVEKQLGQLMRTNEKLREQVETIAARVLEAIGSVLNTPS